MLAPVLESLEPPALRETARLLLVLASLTAAARQHGEADRLVDRAAELLEHATRAEAAAPF